jgi:nicotinamide-nucleotide amidase
MKLTQAYIITIGDELLIGQTIDTNSAWIAQRLNALGIDMLRRVAVADEKKAIVGALDEALAVADIILLTGGLGPTADDITKPLLCEYFGGKLVINEKVLEHVKAIFTRRKRPFLDRNMAQAEVPDVATVLFNRMGTAPGMWFEKNGKVVIAMPGVPFEMEAIMQDEVLPRLKERYKRGAIVHRTTITAGEGESFIAEQIKDLEAALPPHIKLAYLPGPGVVKLRLTGRGEDEALLRKEVAQLQDLFAERLEKIVVVKEDKLLEQVLAVNLLERKLFVGLAESCTGGLIAEKLTNIPGASNFFMGSIVSYLPPVKERVVGVPGELIAKYGVVSSEVAAAMAAGAKNTLGTDIGFGVTGVLSPSDDYPVPAGTIWMAVADKDRVVTKEFLFHYDRKRNKEMAAQNGLLLMLRFIQNKL